MVITGSCALERDMYTTIQESIEITNMQAHQEIRLTNTYTLFKFFISETKYALLSRKDAVPWYQ